MGNIKHKTYVVRPVALIGFTYMIASAAANSLPLFLSAVLSVICIAITLLASFVKPFRKQRPVLILLTAGIAFGCYFLYTHFNYQPALLLDGKSGNASGEVLDISASQSGKTVYTIRLDRNILHTPVPVKVKLYLEEPVDVTVSDQLYFYASFYLPSEEYGTANPLQSAKSDGIFLYASGKSADTAVAKADGFHLNRAVYNLRSALKSKARLLFSGEEAAIFQAMLLGDKTDISSRTQRDFVRTGILHIMVVSGLHLVLLTQFLLRTLKALHVKRKPRYLAALPVIFVMMAISGFTPSINRAGLMLLLFYAAKLLDRSSDSVTSLAAAGLLFTLPAPYLVTDLGFQLTYLATLGIILLSGKLSGRIVDKLKLKNGFLLWAVELICVTIAANLFILPVGAYHFKGLAVLSPIFNLLLSPLFSVILTLGIIVLLIAFVPLLSTTAELLAAVLTVLIKAVRGIAALCSAIPFSYLPLGFRYVYFLLIAFILLFVFFFWFCTFRHKYKVLSAVCAGLLFLSVTVHAVTYRNVLTVAVCNRGRDSAIAFVYRNQMLMLGCNDLALELTDTAGISKIPFVLTDDSLSALAETARAYQLDTLCTDSIVPTDTIPCREICAPANRMVTFSVPLQLEMKQVGEKTYCAVQYGHFNFIYGSYDQHLESLYRENMENIYILVNDCNSVFQKPVKYAIMLDSASYKAQKANPLVTFIDGSGQGITPVRVRQTGEIKAKGAGQWLY